MSSDLVDVPLGSTQSSDTIPSAEADGLRTKSLALFVVRWWSVALFVVIGLIVTYDPPYTNAPAIRSDGLGYHAWTRAILDGNVSFCPYEELRPVAALLPETSEGRCANIYPPGLALLRFPIMAPFTAANHGHLRSLAEDRVNQLLSLAAGVVAMVTVIAAASMLKVRRWLANFAAGAVMFGTNEFHFATYDSSFTHIYSAALFGCLLLLFTRVAVSGRPLGLRGSLAVGLLVGFLVDIRLMLIAPLAVAGLILLITEARKLGGLANALRSHRLVVTLAIGGALLALLQQLLYTRYIYGVWKLSAYSGENFKITRGQQLHVLFSIRKGAIPWSPMIGVALFATAIARKKLMTVLLVSAALVFALIYGSWFWWDLAGGFGHRGYVELTPLCALCLALALSRFSLRGRMATYAFSGAAILLTLGLMRAYWTTDIDFYGASASDYFHYGIGSENFVLHYFRDWFVD